MFVGEKSYRGFDFQGSMSNLNQNQNQDQSVARHDSGLPLTLMVTSQDCVHHNLPITEYNNDEKRKNSTSEDNVDGHNESKKNSSWQRVKWMDKMAKLMITALSYIGEDSGFNNNNWKKIAGFQRKSKWRLVSRAMDERGYRVSPQQCEDKFNELNKRYKKLNEMLGRGTSCEVVENPALLDKIDYLNAKEKDEVRKIMSSKHLFYEEMCSYNNGNRLHLPHDPALQRSLQLMLRISDDLDNDEYGKHHNEDPYDEVDDYEDCGGVHRGALGGPSKRLRRSQSHEDDGHSNHVSSREGNQSYVTQLPLCQAVDNRGMSLENGTAASLQKQRIESKTLELEEQKLHIQGELMELERQRFKWEIYSKKRDQKLEKMRVENEKMKLENERMTLECKRAELGARLF